MDSNIVWTVSRSRRNGFVRTGSGSRSDRAHHRGPERGRGFERTNGCKCRERGAQFIMQSPDLGIPVQEFLKADTVGRRQVPVDRPLHQLLISRANHGR